MRGTQQTQASEVREWQLNPRTNGLPHVEFNRFKYVEMKSESV